MSLMGLTRKEAVKYMRDQEALLLTAIPSKRVVQQHDFYHNVPNEDQEIYAMMSDVEWRIYLEQLAKGGKQGGEDQRDNIPGLAAPLKRVGTSRPRQPQK